jgi:putative membrane protein
MTKTTSDSNDLAEQRTDWAEDRTDLAEDRTIQATERTYAGWLRTAFAAIGIGLGFRALFGEFDPPWLAKAIATIFILIGGLVSWSAQRNACKTLDRLNTHSVDAPRALHMRWLSYIVTSGALILVAALWLLRKSVVA